jgi:hypothetical protein
VGIRTVSQHYRELWDSHQLIIIYLDKSPVTFWLPIQENFVPRIKWQEWQRALNSNM